MEYFESLDSLLRTFWYVAIPSSLIFILQTIMTFIGADASDGIDADFDSNLEGTSAPFQLFSFRNLINFLLGFGWTGVSFYDTIQNHTYLIALSVLVGLLFVYVFLVVIRQMQKLSENNSFQFSDTVGKTADVYLPIPAKKSGKGKVMISVKGSTRELDAMSENEAIASNAVVRVLRVDNEILIVESL